MNLVKGTVIDVYNLQTREHLHLVAFACSEYINKQKQQPQECS